MIFSKQTSIVAVLLWLVSPLALAAGALGVDDAVLVEAKTCQIDSWARKNTDSREGWLVTGCNPTGQFEIALGNSLRRSQGSTQWSDVSLQVKTLFKPVTPNSWGVGLAAGVVQHRADGGQEHYVNVPVSFSLLSDRLLVHANAGWLRDKAAGKNHRTWGLGSEIQLTDRVTFLAETVGQHADRPLVQLGFRWGLLPDRLELDTTVGRQAHQPEARWLAVALRFSTHALFP